MTPQSIALILFVAGCAVVLWASYRAQSAAPPRAAGYQAAAAGALLVPALVGVAIVDGAPRFAWATLALVAGAQLVRTLRTARGARTREPGTAAPAPPDAR